MILTKIKPHWPFRSSTMQNCCDSSFSNFWKDSDLRSPLDFIDSETRTPYIDVEERNDSFLVSADLPGISEDEINVTLEGQALNISVGKKEENEEATKRYVLHERRTFAFTRSFSLPSSVDSEAVEASFKKGVLEIMIPKKEEEKPRKIELK